MNVDEALAWPDDDHPHEPARAEAQRAGLTSLLQPPPRRVLDVGCGAGRVLVPLARAGHEVTGLDIRSEALDACRGRLDVAAAQATLIEADFCDAWPVATGSFDAVLCLGNTFMLLVEVDAAVAFLRRAAAALHEDGVLVLDDLPRDLWPQLTTGHWQSGVSEDGSMQMAWAADDAIFTLRRGGEVDPSCDAIRPGDRRYRLWTMGALRLAADASGLSAPDPDSPDGLLVMRRSTVAATGPKSDLT